METPTTYATYTEIVAANQLIIVHPRAIGIGCSTLSITTKCKHMYVNVLYSIERTVHRIPSPLIVIRLRVHQYNVHPPYHTHSR